MTLSIANVDSTDARRIDAVFSTLDQRESDKLNPLITRSPELDRILQRLGKEDVRICVIDAYRRVRGVYGGAAGTTLCSQQDTISAEVAATALEGQQTVLRHPDSSGESVIVAAYPVYSNEDVLGAVMVEKDSSHILGMQRASLLQIIVATFIVFLVAIFGLLLFAAWLAYRIRRLQQEASQAIDSDGRVIADQLRADQYAADEIGRLSRDFSSLLARLNRYTGFLESIPRTLRHEILNPVNTISMALQKIEAGETSESMISSARRAAQQLEMIVHGLTEAAHIEDALMQDEIIRFDMAAMVKEYVVNSKLKHGKTRLVYHGPESGVYVRGNDLRIAQLIDKLKDNALDFSDADSRVRFELDRHEDEAKLSVVNEGPSIPQEVLDSLFHGMISRRPEDDGRPHLGIGLYIANRIAQQNGGEMQISNHPEQRGVRVSLVLPVDE